MKKQKRCAYCGRFYKHKPLKLKKLSDNFNLLTLPNPNDGTLCDKCQAKIDYEVNVDRLMYMLR